MTGRKRSRAIITVLGIVFAPQLMGVIAGGFKNQDPSKMELTIQLTRTLMPIAFFMMLSGLCNGILNLDLNDSSFILLNFYS